MLFDNKNVQKIIIPAKHPNSWFQSAYEEPFCVVLGRLGWFLRAKTALSGPRPKWVPKIKKLFLIGFICIS